MRSHNHLKFTIANKSKSNFAKNFSLDLVSDYDSSSSSPYTDFNNNESGSETESPLLINGM